MCVVDTSEVRVVCVVETSEVRVVCVLLILVR